MNRFSVRVRRVAIGLTCALVVAVPAIRALGASHSDQTDGNDTPGPLDVREVAFDHHPAPRWTFQTFARWRIDRIWDHGYFVVELDTRRDDDPDVRLIVRSDGHDLVGTLVDIRRDGRAVERGAIDVGRPNDRSVSIRVLLRKLGIGHGRLSYFWSAFSIFTGSGCRRTCVDRVPDEGSVEQLLAGATPTPTPTPTSTPTPTPTPTP